MDAVLIPYKASQKQSAKELCLSLQEQKCKAEYFTFYLDEKDDKGFALSSFLAEVLCLEQYDAGLVNKAFFLQEAEYAAYCCLLALRCLLDKNFEKVAICSPDFDLGPSLFHSFKKDSIRVLTTAALPHNEIQLGEMAATNQQGIQVCAGACINKFVDWCLERFTYLYNGGYSSIADTVHNGQNGEQEAAFYLEWLYFAPSFGVGLHILPAKADMDILPTVKENDGYGWNAFSDGVPIHPLLKPYFARNYRLRFACQNNPFEHRELFTTHTVVTGECTGIPLTAMADCIWLSRPDLQEAFPDYRLGQRREYMQWFAVNAGSEYQLPIEYITPVNESLKEHNDTLPAQPKGRLNRLVKRMKGAKGPSDDAGNAGSQQLEKGINLCAHIRGEYGIGEASRALASSIQAAEIPFGIVDIASERNYRYISQEWNCAITNRFDFGVNLLYTNADGLQPFLKDVSPQGIDGRYNIGYWSWEMPEFPDEWLDAFEPLDEVWTISQYAADAIAKKSPVPVVNIPHSISLPPASPQFSREYFGLGQGFVFLTMYDVRSVAARKNPMGAIRAFVKAFGNREDVQLCVKVNAPSGWEPDEELLKTVKKYKNICLLNRFLTRSQLNALLYQCDAFVSLHRCEGFGLGPAEAMYYGKVAVLTNWSGNTEYMRPDACCPVSYQLVELEKDYGPYKKGWHWAEPNIEDAAKQMLRLVQEPGLYKTLAKNGQKTIGMEFSPEGIGERIKKRMNKLNLL